MQFTPALAGDAAGLARAHAQVLQRLPATVQAFVLVELQKWASLFPAEQRYQRALLEHLSGARHEDLVKAGAPITRVEIEAGCNRIARGDPARFQEEAQALLRRNRLLSTWRKEIDGFFQQIDPAVEARLHPADGPRRVIVQIYGRGIAIQPDKLWARFKGSGARVPLALQGASRPDAFLSALLGSASAGAAPSLIQAFRGSPGVDVLDGWAIEAGDALHRLLYGGNGAALLAGLSYERLRQYRDDLTRALYSKIQSGVESPQAFASYARSLRIAPAPGALMHPADVIRSFVRDVLLTGNGTLFVNNTFVEWATVQALRRAQPRLVITGYGVRDRLKPFSSLLLFSQPRASDQIPLIEDPVGSFVDVEQLAYYVWLNAEKSAAYRGRTLYLFAAEGFDEMLAIRPDAAAIGAPLPPATLADVCATMARWMGVALPASSGRPIEALSG